MMKSRCLCTGILCADIPCWPIDHLPVAGELIETRNIGLALGGCAANVALDLAKLEVPVLLSGSIGDDALSDFILNAVSVPGIDTSLLRRHPNTCPGTVMHINVVGEDRRFICATGANGLYTYDEQFEQAITQKDETPELPKILYLGGFLMLEGLENAQTPELLKKAQKHGWTTILDVVLYGNRPYWDAVKPLLPYIDLIMPNDLEAQTICGKTTPLEQGQFFLDHGVKEVVITQGEKGTLYYSPSLKFETGIFPTEFVSGAGSGDAFGAGYITAMLNRLSPEECVRWGSALGASCVRGVSTTESVFNRKEAEEFLAQNQLSFRTISD